MSETHILELTLDDEGYVRYKVICPFPDGPDRPCASWAEKLPDEPCTCECESCKEGDHENCESDYIDDIGTMDCQAKRIPNECWYAQYVNAVGREVLSFPNEMVVSIPVTLTGYGSDSPIEVTPPFQTIQPAHVGWSASVNVHVRPKPTRLLHPSIPVATPELEAELAAHDGGIALGQEGG